MQTERPILADNQAEGRSAQREQAAQRGASGGGQMHQRLGSADGVGPMLGHRGAPLVDPVGERGHTKKAPGVESS
ncbi:MAG: hypothetical protein DCC55_18790 [Chloroflexi bacterium]|nr:MAG: hypothetical protein DCC55_18790 [Chloroflexota bacterium]